MSSAKGFTLLEVMVSVAIMAGVIITILGAVNYHLSIVSNERDSTALTLLARIRMAEMELLPAQQKEEGTFAPAHPDVIWRSELEPAQFPGLLKQVLRVQRKSDKREVVLVRFLSK